MALRAPGWRLLTQCPAELRLSFTLPIGQAFQWRQTEPMPGEDDFPELPDVKAPLPHDDFPCCSIPRSSEWTGAISRYVFTLRETPHGVFYRRRFPEVLSSAEENSSNILLLDYFRFSPENFLSLKTLYQQWNRQDRHFSSISPRFPGVRLLRQNPFECLLSFICSSNNHIGRISSMLESFRSKYGEFLGHYQGFQYYSFPTMENLLLKEGEDYIMPKLERPVAPVDSEEFSSSLPLPPPPPPRRHRVEEETLRAMGFGYRAKYIVKTLDLLQESGGESFLYTLRTLPRLSQEAELMKFSGVGRKVANCVSLFSLDCLDCIPVDTHVYQIAERDYPEQFKGIFPIKSLTPGKIEEIGGKFREIFLSHAGWAHSVLFAADLRIIKEMTGEITTAKGKKEKIKKEIKLEEEKKEIQVKVEFSASEGLIEKAVVMKKKKSPSAVLEFPCKKIKAEPVEG